MATQRIASGQTPQGATAWQVYSPSGIMVDIDTSAGKFSSVPVYITSIGGRTRHWSTTGASSIYPTPPALHATATGFRVYVRWANGGPLTPAMAISYGWHINWIGMEI
jgi:hypothetical protein